MRLHDFWTSLLNLLSWQAKEKFTRDNRYEPFTASDNMNSLIGMIFSSISKAPVGVLGNAEKIMRHASFCTFESFFARYFLFTPSTQDVHAYVIGWSEKNFFWKSKKV